VPKIPGPRAGAARRRSERMPLNAQDAVLTLASGRLRAEPQQSWELFQSAWPILERYVCLRLANGGLAGDRLGDCAQEVFVRVWSHRRSYRGSSEGEFWKWITRICDNERFRFLRRGAASAIAAPLDSSHDPAATAAPVGHGIERGDASVALLACLRQLAPLESRIVQLIYFEPAISERATAQLLDLSPATVHKLKMQALAVLAQCLQAKGIDA
jgi:RNA polymerase sigma factor (sigma-70 family)